MDIAQLKQAMSCWSTGVTVITTKHAGEDWGMTCNSFNTVSLDPPLLLWSIRKSSMSRDAYVKSDGYTVNILAADQHDICNRFTKGDHAARFAGLDLQRHDSGRASITGSLAWFDCVTEQVVSAGDHDILIGRVLSFGTHPDLANQQALMFTQREFGTLLKL